LGVATTDFGEMFPVTESILSSSRSANGIVVVVVVVVVVQVVDVVVEVVVDVVVEVVVGATELVVGARVEAGAGTATASAASLKTKPRTPANKRAPMVTK
jgi:hypothetical protein